MKLPTKIPAKLKYLFWDVKADSFNPSKNPLYVIQRVLDQGNLEAVKWVRKNFGDELIKETLQKVRNFNARTGNFWRLFLNIPQNQIACLNPHYQEMRKALWPF